MNNVLLPGQEECELKQSAGLRAHKGYLNVVILLDGGLRGFVHLPQKYVYFSLNPPPTRNPKPSETVRPSGVK